MKTHKMAAGISWAPKGAKDTNQDQLRRKSRPGKLTQDVADILCMLVGLLGIYRQGQNPPRYIFGYRKISPAIIQILVNALEMKR
jgi:hypothetical protein